VAWPFELPFAWPLLLAAAAGRPLELIDGPALLTLLAEYSGLKARLEQGPE
jgi:hypothetical protein